MLYYPQSRCPDRLDQNNYALAAFAGHESPEMTFAHYLHFSDWISSIKLNQAQHVLTQKQALQLRLNSRKNLKSINVSDNVISSIPYLINKLSIKAIQSEIKDGTTPQLITFDKAHNTNSIHTCYELLKLYNTGISSLDIAYRYCIKKETIDKWVKNALYIKSLKTNSAKPRSRHFSTARENSILPAKPKTIEENKQVDRFIIKLRTQFKPNSHNISQMLDYALKNSSVSKSGIYFNDPQLFSLFIDTFDFMISKSAWRVVTFYQQNSQMKDEWGNSISELKSLEGEKSSVNGKIGQGAVRLELISPNEKQYITSTGHKKHSSHHLMYLIHMMGIMMMNVQ